MEGRTHSLTAAEQRASGLSSALQPTVNVNVRVNVGVNVRVNRDFDPRWACHELLEDDRECECECEREC